MAGEPATSEDKATTHHAARRVKHNPFWGFGWVGWAGLVVLVALAVAAFRGTDLILETQALLWDSIPRRHSYAVATSFSYFGTVGFLMLTVGPLCLIPAALILYWAPRRLRRRAQWAALLAAISAPILLIWPVAIFGMYPFRGLARALGFTFEGALFSTLMSVLAIAIIWVLTRSWPLCGFWLLWIAVGGAITYGATYPWLPAPWYWYKDNEFILPVAIWNGVLIAVTLRWAIHAHLTEPKLPHCPECEYDLAGLEGATTCPECGAAIGEARVLRLET